MDKIQTKNIPILKSESYKPKLGILYVEMPMITPSFKPTGLGWLFDQYEVNF